MESYDLIIVGGGPGGATCAAFAAKAGVRTLVLERSAFPREKVCGDCLNPNCWPIIERLELGQRLRDLPHAVLEILEVYGPSNIRVRIPLPHDARPEIAVKRSHFDRLLLDRAADCGAVVRNESTVTSIKQPANVANGSPWNVQTESASFRSRWLVAADGRNSTVARLLGLLPPARPDRVGLQTHFPLPDDAARRVVMRFLDFGYCGLADVGGGIANLCLVGIPQKMPSLKTWAETRFGLSTEQPWRTITPLGRAPAPPARDGLFLVGDAARVVEPFTGEGIYYSLASGELAARCIAGNATAQYPQAHRRLYHGRLWINQIARFACLHPRFAQTVLHAAQARPAFLSWLTHKVTAARSSGETADFP